MRKVLISLIFTMIFSINTVAFAFYETLPKDIGSNSSIMEIISPEEKEVQETIEYKVINIRDFVVTEF